MKYCRPITALLFLLSTLPAFGQGAVLQGGGRTAGHVPMYVGTGTGGQTTVQDSGPASGGAVGLGLSELAITSRGTGTPPYVSQGTGPDGTTFCSYDAPTTNATGYHYLCMSPNTTVGGVTGSVISAGAGGIASQLPLYLCTNGTCFTPGSSTPSLTVGTTPVTNGTNGGLLYDNSGVLGNIASVGIGQPLVSSAGATAPSYSGAWLYFDTINKFQRITKNATGWTPTNLNTLLHLVGPNSGAETSIEIQSFNTDAVFNGIRANGTASAPTALANNDQINTMASGGYNGSAIAQGPVYGVFASENWTPTQNGSDHRWYLIQRGGTNFTQSMTLRDYNLGVGTETNPKYRITAGKNATAGITSPFGNDGFGAIGADGGAISYEAIAFSNTPLVNLYRANGTNASKTAVLSGQQMGGVFGNGWDGSSWQVGSGIYFQANQNWSGGVAGSNIGFFTNANGGTTSAAEMTLSSTGLGIGTTTPKAPLDINSNLASSPALVVSTSLARMQAADAAVGGMEWVSYGASPGNVLTGAVAGGTAASPTAAPANKSMFNLRGYGHTGSAWALGGIVNIRSDGIWSGSSQGTTIDFYTTPNSSTTIGLVGSFTSNGAFQIGPTAIILSASEVGMNKISASGTAPGAGTGKLAIVAGTNAGTCKLIMYAGTSNTPTTVLDNVGAGC